MVTILRVVVLIDVGQGVEDPFQLGRLNCLRRVNPRVLFHGSRCFFASGGFCGVSAEFLRGLFGSGSRGSRIHGSRSHGSRSHGGSSRGGVSAAEVTAAEGTAGRRTSVFSSECDPDVDFPVNPPLRNGADKIRDGPTAA